MSNELEAQKLVNSYGIVSIDASGEVISGYDIETVEELTSSGEYAMRISVARLMIARWQQYLNLVELDQQQYNNALRENSHSGD